MSKSAGRRRTEVQLNKEMDDILERCRTYLGVPKSQIWGMSLLLFALELERLREDPDINIQAALASQFATRLRQLSGA